MSISYTHPLRLPNLICSFKPKKPHNIIPARDWVIDFGKYKGKMLGALPSTYLKWVSKNLRARDSEHWAKLADQVLQDPLYKDRLEWEFADSMLNGNKVASNLSRNDFDNSTNAVSQLLELSERFGWDNEDKVGWSKVNFELLGTSQGGRIPRRQSASGRGGDGVKEMREAAKRDKDMNFLSESEIRRKQRRERVKFKSEAEMKDKFGIIRKSKDGFVNGLDSDGGGVSKEILAADLKGRTAEINNPFPGREALLKKVLNAKRYL